MPQTVIQLSPEERIAYPYLFSKADSESIGVLVGEKAVAFFAHAELPPTILGKIWQLADQDNAGFLTRQQFDIALRLIGKAQRGLPINEKAISTPGPLCRLKGLTIPGIPQPTSPAPVRQTATALAAPESGGDSLYSISASDKVKYMRMFINAGPHDGLLDGEKARDIFIRSQLSFEKLGQIWALADTQSRGALSVSDFCIAMHLIKVSMSGHLSNLPASLPSSLLESAVTPVPTPAGGPTLPISRQVTGQQPLPPGPLPTSDLLRQSTISSSIRPQYTGRSASGTPSNLPAGIAGTVGSPTALAWDISSVELAQSNVYFDSLDTNRLGYITGDRAVPFMMESKLPGEVLARIWDLADIRGEGKLNREEFAVAMRLIQDTLAGGVESLITKLAPSMIPPSLRDAPALSVIPETSSTQQDLLSLMDDDPLTATKQTSVQNSEYTQPNPTTLPAQLTGNQSKIPSSRVVSPSPLPPATLTAQLTGHSRIVGSTISTASLAEDSGAKLGNLVNQLSSTENGLSAIRDERSRLESETSSTVEQIKTLELKLLTARQAYQIELPVVEELRKKQVEQRSIISQLTGDAITAESELSTLKLEKEQIEGNILRDKEEVRETKKRMAQLEEETQRLKSSLESLKKDSRLQKGLLAIGKKQVSTIEGQKDDISNEMDALTQSLSSLAAPPEGIEAGSAPSVSAVSVPSLPKSTNPFERMLSSMPALSLPSKSTSSEPSDSRNSYQPPQITTSQIAIDTSPFLSASEGVSPNFTSSPNTASFAEAFGMVQRRESDVPSYGDHGVFHDALETTSLNTLSPSPLNDQLTPTFSQHSTNATRQAEHAHKGNESVESSDEDEVEDPIARHLPPGSRSVKPSSFTSDKFPPLEDVEASVQPTVVALSSSHDKAVSGVTHESSVAAVPGSSDQRIEESVPPTGSIPPISIEKSSLPNDAPLQLDQNPMDFGDELEVSDFSADFRTAGAKLPSASSVGATLEDFDSAFENLPQSGSKHIRSATIGTSDQKPKAADRPVVMGFDDGFDDAFVPLDSHLHGQADTKKDQSNSTGFDESFADFDQILANGKPNPGQDEKTNKAKPQGQDPFESPSIPDEPPALPTRPTKSTPGMNTSIRAQSDLVNQPSVTAKADPAKPTDSQAVQEICAMGFDRKVAIEALERDDWDMTRALNHLLGT